MLKTIKAYILIECNVGTTRDVIDGLKRFKGIKLVEAVTVPYDLVAILELSCLGEIGDLVTQNIQLVTGIARTVTFFVFDQTTRLLILLKSLLDSMTKWTTIIPFFPAFSIDFIKILAFEYLHNEAFIPSS